MALLDGFVLLDEPTNELTWLRRPDANEPATRFNQGGVDPVGRFLAGTMTFDGDQSIGNLYSLDTDQMS